jgi:integrase
MRLSEQFELTWDQVYIDGGIIRLPDTKHGDGRFVGLNTRAKAVLQMLHDARTGDERVFTNNLKPRWFTREATVDASVTGVSWHNLRHTFISRLVMAEIDLRTVMELAGHKSISMTMRHAHLAPGHAAQAVEPICAKSKKPKRTATRTATRAPEAPKHATQTIQVSY